MTTALKILGITDERTECECCGKTGLKRTVALDADGVVVYFGSDCAAMALMGKKTASNRKVVETKAAAVAHARRLVAKGHTLTVAAKDVWNRFGFLTEVRGNVLTINGVGIFEF
jgi:ribosome-binding protein aMBF1 (putative translation factor)